MSLIQQIKQDQLAARKEKDAVKAVLLTTLYSEASNVGKNDGNRESTDAETCKAINKFLNGVNETIAHLEQNGTKPEALATARVEKAILDEYVAAYMPKMASEDELRAAIADLKAAGAANIGDIMKGLKQKFGATLDGKLANQLAKK